MTDSWTFGRKIAAGFAVVVALSLAIAIVAVYALRSAVEAKDHVIENEARAAFEAEGLELAVERGVTDSRTFLLTGSEEYAARADKQREVFLEAFAKLRGSIRDPERLGLLDAVARAESEYHTERIATVEARRKGVPADALTQMLTERAIPRRRALTERLSAFGEATERVLGAAKADASQAASSAEKLVLGIGAAALLAAIVIAAALARALGRQIGLSISQIRSSSTELQSAATQQATGAREQATSMNEISTTITELLATSRQIAESAQRVADIAEKTATTARAGDGTLSKASELITTSKKQVDTIVTHMLDLGRKSQQIGAVLQIVSELAEQTNILAINATIEAAGAGEAGRRFGVVADEIRKLADRVGGSTKEVRSLIEDIRSAVNTTVMATETGSKAADAGVRQFVDMAAAFKQISAMVATTTEAAREIGLSTKQQSTAVEQVNIAIASAAQASRETEASSTQTLATASQLAGISKDLVRLVQVPASG